jgi:pimeloyl-ACP methyl ester carboxylesterase
MTAAEQRERLADVGEVELAYETFGEPSDPAVLMIMGLGSQMIFWPEELCEALAAGPGQRPQQRRFVIRFDNRDAGRSTVLAPSAPDLRLVLAGEAEAPYLLEHMASDAPTN